MPNNPTKKPEWQALIHHHKHIWPIHMLNLFAQNSKRFDEFSLSVGGLFADYSKQNMTYETLSLLLSLARSSELESKRNGMFAGDIINTTQKIPALHTALRAPKDAIVNVDGQNIIPFVHDVLTQMKNFCDRVHSGTWTGHTGKPITDIVNIGIGGSDLGPRMAVQALTPFALKNITSYFVSNADGADISDALKSIDPETTLFVIASKTFTTQETMVNAEMARKWLVRKLGNASAVAKHFVALSTNEKAVTDFGIAKDNMFPFRDWVGGRYSLWSAIGLSIALSIGFKNFRALLNGAYAMDTHFKTAPMEQNLPVILGMIGIWNRNFLNRSSLAVIPYDKRLGRFPAFLQQMDMESNGKSVDRDGHAITDYNTGPVIFGEPGTDSQHSFFQKIHQGTDVIPVDFIFAKTPYHDIPYQHTLLGNNMVAQGQALMTGRTLTQANSNPHRVFSGNRPSNTIIVDTLDPYHLGMLIALYEHKVFVQGIVWNVNSFDQFGVELGKEMAKNIETGNVDNADSSTRGLMNLIRQP